MKTEKRNYPYTVWYDSNRRTVCAATGHDNPGSCHDYHNISATSLDDAKIIASKMRLAGRDYV